jgi:predicted HicB family RNase H-like nuclease
LSAFLFTPFEYKGHVELANEASLIRGEVIDLRDIVGFHGTSVEELEGRSATR